MHRNIVLVFLFHFLFLIPGVRAQQTAQKMVIETRYLLYLPEGYTNDSLKKWPLLMFLHGSGESGSDLEKVKFHGPPKLIEKGKKFPFIIISPQADRPGGWETENLYKLIQHVKKNYRVDADRVYLTGLSMGGFGTFKLAMQHPEEFAAIAPVCGGGDTATAWQMRNVPIWGFHGALDDVVLPASGANMVNAASKLNPDARFTLYPNKNHNSWDTTYDASDTLYNWLLTKTRFRYKEVKLAPQVLKKYEGWYKGNDGDTVRIMHTKYGFTALPGMDTVPLRAANGNLFFLDPGKHMDIRFVMDKNKKVNGFWFLGDRKMFYRRISTK